MLNKIIIYCSCGSKMVHEKRNLMMENKILKNVSYFKCENCDDIILPKETWEKADKAKKENSMFSAIKYIELSDIIGKIDYDPDSFFEEWLMESRGILEDSSLIEYDHPIVLVKVEDFIEKHLDDDYEGDTMLTQLVEELEKYKKDTYINIGYPAPAGPWIINL